MGDVCSELYGFGSTGNSENYIHPDFIIISFPSLLSDLCLTSFSSARYRRLR